MPAVGKGGKQPKPRQGEWHLTTCARTIDRTNPAKELTISDETVTFQDTPGTGRKITARAPDRDESHTLLTNEMTLPPGVLSECYRLRWRIEKAFDQQEQKLDERQAWGKSNTVKTIPAIVICMAHNLLQLFNATLKTEAAIEDTKVITAYHSLPSPFWLGSVLALLAAATPLRAATNVPPTAVILSAMQRPGTTFMDIDFRVNDPDDATVETAALGFVNGGTSFSDIVKISTLVEGTAAHLGSNTPANTTLRLTWNVAADWNTNFGQVQVEILAKDSRALLPFHWITLPASGTNPAVTINARPIYDADLLPIWYWLIAKSDPGLQLVNGQVLGVGGDYNTNLLAPNLTSGVPAGAGTTLIGRDFLGKKMALRALTAAEVTRASGGRYGFQSVDSNSVARVLQGPDIIYAWGYNGQGQATPDQNRPNIKAVAVGNTHTLILSGNEVFGFGDNSYGQLTVPASATNLTAIAAGEYHSLALRADGTVIGWSHNNQGQITIPASATSVTAIAAGYFHCLALRAGGSVVGWGSNLYGENTIPASATNVIAIAAGQYHSLALRSDGTVIAWGDNSNGQLNVPAGLSSIDLLGVGGMANHVVVVDKRTP